MWRYRITAAPRKVIVVFLAMFPAHLISGGTLSPEKKQGPCAREVRTLQLPEFVSGILACPNGKYLAVGARHRVHVIDVGTGAQKVAFEHMGIKGSAGVKGASFSRNGASIASHKRPYGVVDIWDTETGNLTFRIPAAGTLQFAFLPDAKTGLSASTSSLQWWEIDNKLPAKGKKAAPTKRVTIQGNFLNIGAFSLDLKWFAGANMTAIKIWSVSTGEEKHTMVISAGSLSSLCYSPDGRWLASSATGTSAKPEKCARIWDPKTGQEVRTLTTPDHVLQVAFSPDGKWFAAGTGTADKSVRIWETATWREALRLHDPHAFSGSVAHLAFVPKTDFLVTANLNDVRFWELALDRLPKNGPLVTIEAKPRKKAT